MNTAAKISTSVWAKRLSKSVEQHLVLESSQEGFRPDRSARRQISRFISALQDVERNQGTICVTFLDFENYFNTISLPALFLLLRKFGLNENDVQALEVDARDLVRAPTANFAVRYTKSLTVGVKKKTTISMCDVARELTSRTYGEKKCFCGDCEGSVGIQSDGDCLC